jgi:defect-in-organelle-trafficking protein DotB
MNDFKAPDGTLTAAEDSSLNSDKKPKLKLEAQSNLKAQTLIGLQESNSLASLKAKGPDSIAKSFDDFSPSSFLLQARASKEENGPSSALFSLPGPLGEFKDGFSQKLAGPILGEIIESNHDPLAININQPGDWTRDELIRLMNWGKTQKMSDLILTSQEAPWMRIGGRWTKVGERKVNLSELSALLNYLTRNEAAASMVSNGVELDFGCDIPLGRLRRLRFRGNATAIANGWSTGLTVTLRALAELPPDLESLGVEKELAEALFPENGLVLVTGVMGSGKSTFLAAALKRLAEKGQRHIATYEQPIEFDLSEIGRKSGPIEQSEIPKHLPGFVQAARNVTRRAADAVLIGEARDPETIKGLMEAAEIGITAYATCHTRSVSDTIGRLISVFDRQERDHLASMLLSAIRVIVQQRLYPDLNGGRVAVREYLVFDRLSRQALQKEPIERLGVAVEKLVRQKGQSLEKALRRACAEGRLPLSAAKAAIDERNRAHDGL